MQQMFRMIGYGENIGSGFPSILKIWKDEHWAVPELTEKQDLNEADLFLKIDVQHLSSDKSSDNLTEKQWAILHYIKEHPTATQIDLANNIEGLSFASAKYQINVLRKAGFLKREGSNKTGRLIVIVP